MSSDRFLDAATQPFADNAELQVHARRALEERMSPDSMDDPSWQEAAATMEQHAGSRAWKHWRKILFWIVLVAALAILPVHFLDTQRNNFLYSRSQTNKWYLLHENFLEGSAKQDEYRIGKQLSAEQRLILFGDPSKSSPSDRLEGLWKRFPDNPVYYAAFARSYRGEHGTLPRDFLTTAAAIDPDNGWFPYFAAAKINPIVTSPSASSTRRSKVAPVPKWTIRRRPDFDAALDLLRQSAALPRFDSYMRARQDEMRSLLPDARDLGDILRQSGILSLRNLAGHPWYDLSNVISAQAEITADGGDREGFKRLCADWATLLEHLSHDPESSYMAKAWIKGTLPNLQDAAGRLGLQADQEQILEAQRRLEASAAEKRNTVVGNNLWGHVGLTTEWVPFLDGHVPGKPVYGLSDLTPSRLAEHAWRDRMLTIQAAAAWMVLAAICGLYRFRHRLPIRVPGCHLTTSFVATDWLWLFGGGIVVPWVYGLIIHYLTPLGGRDWSISHSDPTAQLQTFSAIALAGTASLLIARWRIHQRLPELASTPAGQRAGWIVLMIAVITVPLAGLSIPPESPSAWQVVGIAGLVPLAIWLVITMLRALFGKAPASMARQAVACLMTSACLSGALLTLCMIPLQHAEERYWTARDAFVPRAQSSPHGVPNVEELVRSYEKQRTEEALEILVPIKEIPR